MRPIIEALRRVRPIFWAGLGLALAGAGVAVWRRRGTGAGANGGAPFAYPLFLTGNRLTYTTIADDGLIYADPRALAATANSDPETYTLARILVSETSGPPLEKGAIAWAVVNYARRTGKSILALGTTAAGLYGRQRRVGYAATSKDPTDRDLYVATMVLATAWPDPTGGATKWFHSGDQDALFARGEVSYDATGIIEKRRGEGFAPVVLPGTGDLVLFRPV